MLDTARITELKAEIGEDDFAEVVALFCEEVEDVLAALDDTPSPALGGQLHFLKGSAQNIGLTAVVELCLAEEARLRADPVSRPDTGALRAAYSAGKSRLLG